MLTPTAKERFARGLVASHMARRQWRIALEFWIQQCPVGQLELLAADAADSADSSGPDGRHATTDYIRARNVCQRLTGASPSDAGKIVHELMGRRRAAKETERLREKAERLRQDQHRDHTPKKEGQKP